MGFKIDKELARGMQGRELPLFLAPWGCLAPGAFLLAILGVTGITSIIEEGVPNLPMLMFLIMFVVLPLGWSAMFVRRLIVAPLFGPAAVIDGAGIKFNLLFSKPRRFYWDQFTMAFVYKCRRVRLFSRREVYYLCLVRKFPETESNRPLMLAEAKVTEHLVILSFPPFTEDFRLAAAKVGEFTVNRLQPLLHVTEGRESEFSLFGSLSLDFNRALSEIEDDWRKARLGRADPDEV